MSAACPTPRWVFPTVLYDFRLSPEGSPYLPGSLSDIAVRDEAKEMRPDARPQARGCPTFHASRFTVLGSLNLPIPLNCHVGDVWVDI